MASQNFFIACIEINACSSLIFSRYLIQPSKPEAPALKARIKSNSTPAKHFLDNNIEVSYVGNNLALKFLTDARTWPTSVFEISTPRSRL